MTTLYPKCFKSCKLKSMYGLLTKLHTVMIVSFSTFFAKANNKPVRYCELLLPSISISIGFKGPFITTGKNPFSEVISTFKSAKKLLNISTWRFIKLPTPLIFTRSGEIAIMGVNIRKERPLS